MTPTKIELLLYCLIIFFYSVLLSLDLADLISIVMITSI